VEATHREDSRTLSRQPRANVRTSLWVSHGRHDAARLVEREVSDVRIEVHGHAVDGNSIRLVVHRLPERRNSPVDGDPTVPDQLLAGSSRAEAGASEGALEPLGRHGERLLAVRLGGGCLPFIRKRLTLAG